MFGTIVLAVDGSSYSEKAVELAKHLATVGSEEVVVTHVTELLPARFQTYPGLDYEADLPTIELAKQYVADMEEAGIKARAELRSAQYGGIARVLTNAGRGPQRRPHRDGLPRPGGPDRAAAGQRRPQGPALQQRPVLIAR